MHLQVYAPSRVAPDALVLQHESEDGAAWLSVPIGTEVTYMDRVAMRAPGYVGEIRLALVVEKRICVERGVAVFLGEAPKP